MKLTESYKIRLFELSGLKEGYLTDIPKSIAYNIFSKEVPEETKKVIADVIKSIDNQFIAQSLHRLVKNTVEGIPTNKLGHQLNPLNLSKEQAEYILSKMDELHAINQQQKDNLTNSISNFVKDFPLN